MDNILITTNVLTSAHDVGVKKLIYFASNCMYPRDCPQPMKIEHLLTGPFEPTNGAFASAKIAGLYMAQAYNSQFGTNYVSVIPAGLFGPRDNFNPERSHFFPALMKKFHDAKVNGDNSIVLWGTGSPRREALYVKDLADATLFVMDNHNGSEPINLGTNHDYSVSEIADIIKNIVGFEGEIVYDKTKPDGMPRKLLDSSKISEMGWSPKYKLEDAFRETYDWYIKNRI